MSNTDRDALLERWATGMEKLEQYYEGLYGPPATPATLPSITTREGMLETIADTIEQAQKYINKMSPAYNNSTDSYVKTVPPRSKTAQIIKLGGKTIAWNQLVDTGTTSVPTISGHKYYVLTNGTSQIVTSSGAAIASADMVCDLTTMFGRNSEPSLSKFKTMFPAGHYDYNAGELLSANVVRVTSKDSNGNIVDDYDVPATIQGLDGYGWGIKTVYNEVDYTTKKYTKRIAKIVLNGSENWSMLSSNTYPYFAVSIGERGSVVNNIIASNYFNQHDIGSTSSNIGINIINSGGYNDARILVRPSNYTTETLAGFKGWLGSNNLVAYYEITTPAVTDVSAYISEDTFKTTSGGTIEFVNANGETFRIPAPSTEYFSV